MQQHGSKYFARRPLPISNSWGGVKRSKFNVFSHQCQVAYQIKENRECSNMVANILPADPYPPSSLTLGVGSKGRDSAFFLNMVMLYKK